MTIFEKGLVFSRTACHELDAPTTFLCVLLTSARGLRVVAGMQVYVLAALLHFTAGSSARTCLTPPTIPSASRTFPFPLCSSFLWNPVLTFSSQIMPHAQRNDDERRPNAQHGVHGCAAYVGLVAWTEAAVLRQVHCICRWWLDGFDLQHSVDLREGGEKV